MLHVLIALHNVADRHSGRRGGLGFFFDALYYYMEIWDTTRGIKTFPDCTHGGFKGEFQCFFFCFVFFKAGPYNYLVQSVNDSYLTKVLVSVQ